ncbi:MAG: peptide-methionine (S)-S-oxide reductase [Candidimonas sp.]|nr:MAG: peptide-methionine (S)-S-oxide reductase [Candidimonas sp.]
MANTTDIEIAVLGGGCFWCTESVFTLLGGVVDVTPGYAGGRVASPSYERVCQGDTGHIEVSRVRFDPSILSFETLLRVFFATHDPTSLNRQGGDVGEQYASAIFCQNDGQLAVAKRVVAEVERDLGTAVVTRLLGADPFWPAESYHHDYYARNPNQGYCRLVISPKVAKFRKRFSSLLAH